MSTPIGNAVAERDTRPSLAQYIARLQPEMQRALPKHLDSDRMTRLALTEIRKSELAKQNGASKYSLADCVPESFAGALLTAAAVGVEVGTPEAYLVPYKRECTLIIGYQGYTKLFWQHPAAQTLSAEAVYERDEFDWAKGTSPYLKHKPYRGDGGRGKVIFYYAAVSLSTGGSHFEVLTPDEVKALRNGKVGPSGNIADPMRWMERKTAIRQVLKPMPKSSQLNQAIVSDEREGAELYVERLAENQAITAATPPQVEATTTEPEPPATRAARMITRPQAAKLHAVLGDLNVTDRAYKLQVLSALTGRDVDTSSDITQDEAKLIIDTLESVAQRDDPAGNLAAIIEMADR